MGLVFADGDNDDDDDDGDITEGCSDGGGDGDANDALERESWNRSWRT